MTDDPTLRRTDYRCGYCGKDLLATLDDFLSFVRDHLVPKSAGGPDGNHNRVASCAACDRIKETVGWMPRYDDLETIVTTSLKWEKRLSERPAE